MVTHILERLRGVSDGIDDFIYDEANYQAKMFCRNHIMYPLEEDDFVLISKQDYRGRCLLVSEIVHGFAFRK
jgi:hypothetical protein